MFALYIVGEMTEHLGLFELVDASALLLVDSMDSDGVVAEGRGGGSCAREARPCTDEEIDAVRWKCRLHKLSPEAVTNVLQNMPEWCIKQTVEEYAKRSVVAPAKNKPSFI